jgi:signal transduction histidine kinase
VQVDPVLRAATRLKHLIETMLNLRYLETGQMELLPTRFDLRAEVLAACKDYKALADTDGLVISTDVPDEEVSIYADKEKLRVVLDNLISNAVQFTAPGGQVRVKVGHRGQDIEMSVIDSGIGIPPQDLERIFERFYQVEDHMTRKQGGMGLGLSIVKGLVELHGGHVWAESVRGRGSRFVVVLPPRVSAAAAPRSESSPFVF